MLFFGTFSLYNKGDEARLFSTIQTIKMIRPNTSFGFLTYKYHHEAKILKNYDIEIIGAPWQIRYKNVVDLFYSSKSILAFLLSCIFRVSLSLEFKIINNYDAYIDLSGESLSDYFGITNLVFCLAQIALLKMLKKKVIIYAQSIGPFRSFIGEYLSWKILNKVDAITVREVMSFNYIYNHKKIKLKTVYLTADPAFVLPVPDKQDINELLKRNGINPQKRPLIGLDISRGSFKNVIKKGEDLDRTFPRYIDSVVEFIKWLNTSKDAQVIFIPHVIIPGEDDRVIYEQLAAEVGRDNIICVDAGYGPVEMKGIISMCDIFISSRMHPIIAALSTNVPAIAIAYSHKIPSLMQMFDLGHCAIDVSDVTFDKLVEKFDYVWNHKDRIKGILSRKLPEFEQKARENARILVELLESGS
ncbi:polysaccharide pyruvyl transferase family protein [Neomoorella humiferrea]|uniref:polysaccharide pyruvyl transferase family protein n=1 Tax=Neomoorella humiferrea TaxID=676965 RepID=UPI0030CEB9DF